MSQDSHLCYTCRIRQLSNIKFRLPRILQPKILDRIQFIPHFKDDLKGDTFSDGKRQKEKVKKKFIIGIS